MREDINRSVKMHLEETANIVENVDLKLLHTFTRPLQTYFKLFARSFFYNFILL